MEGSGTAFLLLEPLSSGHWVWQTGTLLLCIMNLTLLCFLFLSSKIFPILNSCFALPFRPFFKLSICLVFDLWDIGR